MKRWGFGAPGAQALRFSKPAKSRSGGRDWSTVVHCSAADGALVSQAGRAVMAIAAASALRAVPFISLVRFMELVLMLAFEAAPPPAAPMSHFVS